MDQDSNLLGAYLKERRARLDPAAYGLPLQRRRTPGLRREEVAQLAHVSATWYTWLEQGRGGAPSEDVLERLARAFSLNDEEREHLFLLAQDRPPRLRHAERSEAIPPQLQRVIDAIPDSPAVVKTPDWTVIGWNKAAEAVFADFASMAPGERNLLRRLFRADGHDHLPDWQAVARLLVGSVRRDALRAGMPAEIQALVDELSESSAEFRAMWADQDVVAHGAGLKRIDYPGFGEVGLEYSTFAVDGRPDLALLIFNPATPEDRRKVQAMMALRLPE